MDLYLYVLNNKPGKMQFSVLQKFFRFTNPHTNPLNKSIVLLPLGLPDDGYRNIRYFYSFNEIIRFFPRSFGAFQKKKNLEKKQVNPNSTVLNSPNIHPSLNVIFHYFNGFLLQTRIFSRTLFPPNII